MKNIIISVLVGISFLTSGFWVGLRLAPLPKKPAPVVPVALLANGFEGLEPGEQAGYIRLGGDHARADGRTGKSVRLRSAQNAQNVVLRGSNAPIAGFQVESAVQAVGSAQKVEQRLFFHAGKRRFLRNFKFKASHRRSRQSLRESEACMKGRGRHTAPLRARRHCGAPAETAYCLTTSRSILSFTSSPTTAPGNLAPMPKALRLIIVVAEKPACGL